MPETTQELTQFEAMQAALDLPPMPHTQDARQLADKALTWVGDNIPFSTELGSKALYRPELAIGRGGNCFAQALGLLALVDHWGLSAAIVLDKHEDQLHASVVARMFCKVLFLDKFPGSINSLQQEANAQGAKELASRYEDSLQPKLSRRKPFMLFMARNPAMRHWDTTLDAHPGEASGLMEHDQHRVITDRNQGTDMLLAIGDLARYYYKKPDCYEQALAELDGFIPDFIPRPHDKPVKLTRTLNNANH